MGKRITRLLCLKLKSMPRIHFKNPSIIRRFYLICNNFSFLLSVIYLLFFLYRYVAKRADTLVYDTYNKLLLRCCCYSQTINLNNYVVPWMMRFFFSYFFFSFVFFFCVFRLAALIICFLFFNLLYYIYYKYPSFILYILQYMRLYRLWV